MKKDLKEFALIAEIISAIAIVVSLVFVGLQVQQNAQETSLNTRSIENGAYQDLISQLNSFQALIIENPELLRALNTAQENGELETPEDRTIARNYMLMQVRHADMAYRQFRNGLIDEQSLKSIIIPLRAHITSSFGNQVWSNSKNRGVFNEEFTQYIDEYIAN